MEPPKKRNRIPWYIGGTMLGISLFIDFLQLILSLIIVGLILNPLITIFVWLIFYLWFKLRGINFTDRMLSRLSIIILGGVIEMTPFVGGLLPSLTFSILALVVIARHEDRVYNKEQEDEWVTSMKKLEKEKLLREQQRARLEEQVYATETAAA